jgi:hypothetical protein
MPAEKLAHLRAVVGSDDGMATALANSRADGDGDRRPGHSHSPDRQFSPAVVATRRTKGRL